MWPRLRWRGRFIDKQEVYMHTGDLDETQDMWGELRDTRRCEHIYPDGHKKAGQQCQGFKGSSGFCPGHARSQGLTRHGKGAAEAAAASPEDLQEQEAAVAAAQERARLSLDALAAGWLEDPKTQARLKRRWNDIFDNGSDAELIRLSKELTDRVYGRATEHVKVEEVTVPKSLQEVRDMTPEQRRAFIMRESAAPSGD
jgi:hypothetical protein